MTEIVVNTAIMLRNYTETLNSAALTLQTFHKWIWFELVYKNYDKYFILF